MCDDTIFRKKRRGVNSLSSKILFIHLERKSLISVKYMTKKRK